MCFCEFLIPKVYCIVLFLLASEIREELYLKSSVLSEWSNALSVELCIGPGGTRNRCFLCKLPELLYGKFIFNVSVHNWSLFTWSLTAFPGNWQRATNKAMLPAGYISSRLWQPGGRHWGRTLGIFFSPRRLAMKATNRFLRTQKANNEVLAITHWALEWMVPSKVNGLRTTSSRACWTWSASPWWPWDGAARSAGAGSAGRLSVRWCGVTP